MRKLHESVLSKAVRWEDERDGDETRYCCVFCDDTKYHLYVNKIKGVFHCFKCDAKGIYVNDVNPAQKLASNLDKTIERANSIVKAKKYNLEDISTKNKKIKNLPSNTRELSKEALKYLENRNISSTVAKYYDIRMSLDGRSLIFPIGADDDDNCEYFVQRVMYPEPGESKYLNAPWDKGRTLFFSLTKNAYRDCLVICEGIFDAISVGRIYPDCALLGKVGTPEQIQRLAGKNIPWTNLIVLLDSDAEIPAMRLRMDLMCTAWNKNVLMATLPGGDPGAASIETIKEVVDNALVLIRD